MTPTLNSDINNPCSCIVEAFHELFQLNMKIQKTLKLLSIIIILAVVSIFYFHKETILITRFGTTHWDLYKSDYKTFKHQFKKPNEIFQKEGVYELSWDGDCNYYLYNHRKDRLEPFEVDDVITSHTWKYENDSTFMLEGYKYKTLSFTPDSIVLLWTNPNWIDTLILVRSKKMYKKQPIGHKNMLELSIDYKEDKFILEIKDLKFKAYSDFYFFVIDTGIKEKKNVLLENQIENFKSWKNQISGLASGEIYLPFDFSDQYLGSFKLLVKNGEYLLSYGYFDTIPAASPSYCRPLKLTANDNFVEDLPAFNVNKNEMIKDIDRIISFLNKELAEE
ncbi:hypothetical protein [Emticicia sp. 21SJ11W-3]|uniref:hypothetical protein n=1 Tax=Emticicia sp. 21SJ11W-3 TaxID=2916755 RepID=UPI0020A1CDA0|nr:hypothetical protein [Emticicia sp. 21SJ11W-3]UTA66511.1 hypothetical protein MB380_12970 [Emticicia sp. 21SJ11W-3]